MSFLPKIYDLSLIRRQQIDAKYGTSYKMTAMFKRSQKMKKTKEKSKVGGASGNMRAKSNADA